MRVVETLVEHDTLEGLATLRCASHLVDLVFFTADLPLVPFVLLVRLASPCTLLRLICFPTVTFCAQPYLPKRDCSDALARRATFKTTMCVRALRARRARSRCGMRTLYGVYHAFAKRRKEEGESDRKRGWK